MSITINDLDDYKNAEILGLEASDRAPNDYLRLTSKVFNSFKPIDPTKTISSYIDGLETTVQKIIINNENNLEFYIQKGSAFVDDQFIAFTDDIVFNIPTSKLVNNVDYYLVIYYQYSNQCLYNPAIFDYVAASSYNEATMLKVIQFKMSGYDLIVYPQNLDDMFIENYSRLFKLVSDKAIDLFKINSYQGISVSGNKLYKNSTNPEYSTKSGDVVFLDLDGLYKPARACNRKIDKALGLYIYNPKSGAHMIITNGLVDFEINTELDISNTILLNMEPGKSYYLLDNCSETNYAWEDGQQSTPGKMSSRFTPGNVRVGFAVDNKKFMVDFQLADEMNTANFLELIGLPQHFQDRFNIIYAYWNSIQSKEFRTLFAEELQILKEELALQKNQMFIDSQTQENDYLNKGLVYNNVLLANTPVVSIGSAIGPISTTTLKNTLVDQNTTMNKFQSENEFKYSKISYLNRYIPDFILNLDQNITDLNNTITYLTNLSDNFTLRTQSNLYFEEEYKISSFSSSLNGFKVFKSAALPAISRLSTSSINVTVKTVPSNTKNSGNTSSTTGTTSKAYTSYYTTSNSSIVETPASTLIGPVTTYNATDEVIGNYNTIEAFKSNNTVLTNTLSNIKNIVSNVKTIIDLVQTAIEVFDTNAIEKLLDPTGNTGPSIKLELNNLGVYLFGNPKLSEVLSSTYGIAHYLNKIHYFMDDSNNDIDFDIYTNFMEIDAYSIYYILRYLVQEIEDIQTYLLGLSGTSAQNDAAQTLISDTIEVYDQERKNYIETKFNTFGDYQESLRAFSNLILDINDIDLDIDDLNARITSENSLIIKIESDILNMDQQIIERINNQSSVNTILYISEYERRIYNYTYLTIRIRLKQKLLISINNDVQIINDILLQLKSQTIPNRSLIDKTQVNLNAFVSVLNNLTTELEGMIMEYNNLRTQFGIDDPILITDYDFNDHGLADPNLDCFQNLNTFDAY